MDKNLEHDKFKFSYLAPTKYEREQIEDIRKNYLPKSQEENKFEKMKKLDSKVKNVPTIWGFVVGIIGILIFGLGMTMVLEWNIIIFGIAVCLIGLIPMIFAYFIYKKLKDKLTEKYKDEILNLSEELLNEEKSK